ncbi:MAG: hypothetical protein ACP5LA_03040 [Thermoplasmata archaeon]
MKKQTYKNKKNRMNKIINNLLVIILIGFGAGIGFLPMMEYYSGPYHAETYYNSIRAGSEFTFVGTVGGYNNSSRSGFTYGFLINVTFLNTNEAQVYITVFQLPENAGYFNIFLLPKNPFYPEPIKIDQFNYKTSISSSPLLKLLFLSTYSSDTLIGNITLNRTNFNMQPYPNFGMPNLNYIVVNGTNTPFFYILYENFRVLGYLAEMPHLVNFLPLIKDIYPGANYSKLNCQIFTIQFGSSNTAPPQNWAAFYMWGFGMAFPLDIIIIAAGIILYVMRFRR